MKSEAKLDESRARGAEKPPPDERLFVAEDAQITFLVQQWARCAAGGKSWSIVGGVATRHDRGPYSDTTADVVVARERSRLRSWLRAAVDAIGPPK